MIPSPAATFNLKFSFGCEILNKEMKKRFLIYNIDAFGYFESLLIAAVTTIFGIRFYLDLTGYPQIGGGGLHIAHMLWGGLLMLLCIVMLLTFLNRPLLHFASIMGGIGFGAFIDELGKFITSDNNYFFEPTFAIIYIIFILLFILYRFFEKRHKLSVNEYLSNAFELTRQAATEGIDPQVKDRALDLLKKCDASNIVVKHLYNILRDMPSETAVHRGFLTKIKQSINAFYSRIMRKEWFTRGIVIFFVIFSLFNLWRAIDVVSLYFKLQDFSLSFIDLGKFISSIISSIIVVFGILIFQRSHAKAYNFFKFGLLFSLFVTQFFDFYSNQLLASRIFIFYILILFVLNTVVDQENVKISINNHA